MNRKQKKVKCLNATFHTKNQKIINKNKLIDEMEQQYQSHKGWLLIDQWIQESDDWD